MHEYNIISSSYTSLNDAAVFDIGAGDGRFLTTCAGKTGACCTGIEINEDRVTEALQVWPDPDFIVNAGYNIPISSTSVVKRVL